ncbi:MAG: MATE family efflux transporter, partial [Bacteroidota bacterium]|nr:MATE family efflux transporter [Bacteroidota bacterium]
AVAYFRIYMLGMFFSVIFHSAVSILRGLGDATTQLYFLIPANILNMVLSYIFLGIIGWKIEASAWASFISQFVAFASLFLFLRKKHEFVHLPSLKHLYFNKVYLKKIINIGIPTGLQQSIVSLTQILILSLVTSFGTDAIAGYSTAVRVESIALILVLNFGQALTSFVGTNIGANNIARAKQGLKVSIKLMATISLFIFFIFYFLDKELIRLFTTETKVIQIGGEYLVVDAIFWFLFATMMMFTSYFRGVGYAFVTLVISFITLLLVRFPLSMFLSSKFDILGIWLGAPFAWLLAIIIYIFCFKFLKINFSKLIKE